MRQVLLAGLIMATGGLNSFGASAESNTIFSATFSGDSTEIAEAQSVALGGFDPTLYFAGGLPQRGDPSIAYVFEGQVYYFKTLKGRQEFASNPKAFAPQYGGHCAFAMSETKTVLADPSVYTLQEGKLYLFENEMKLEMWKTNSRKFRLVADKRWEIEAKNFTSYKTKF